MQTARIQPTLESWRATARAFLSGGIPPGEILWSDQPEEDTLFEQSEFIPPIIENAPSLKVPSAFLKLARTVALHTDSKCWSVLYSVLWRLTRGGEPRLLAIPTDADIRQLQLWEKAIRRDIHKMHAFVRFQLVAAAGEESARESFAAWFEPEHRILRAAAPFFARRFAGMDWSILTPHECAHWDGDNLHFTPGVQRGSAPGTDALTELWRTYYRSIFNPARLKVKAMQSEMPIKYWKNLPEAPLIEELIRQSAPRVQEMLDTPATPPKPAPPNPYLTSLRQKNTP